MEQLTPLSKLLVATILVGSSVTPYHTYGARLGKAAPAPVAASSATAQAEAAASAAAPAKKPPPVGGRPIRVAISQWPGHMPLVVAAGGLKTQPGSPLAREGLDLEVVFIEDAPSKNKALQSGEVDFVWQTVDELPMCLGGYRAAGLEVRAFLQIDWSRGGDACIASEEGEKVEDVVGRKSAVLMFSP